jgi:DNA-binding HxlR family transcriptional regulator
MPESTTVPKSYGQYCAAARALDHVGDRWTLLVVRELLVRPMRFAELLDGLPGIATNLLTDRLRRLEADGLIEHLGHTYSLTPLGGSLRPVIDSLVVWGGRYMAVGRQGQAFRPHWLGVALGVLGRGRRPAGTVRVHTEEGPLVMRGGAQGLVAVDGWTGPVDTEMRCRIEELMGVLAGVTTTAQLCADGRAHVDGDVAAVDELLRPRRALYV